MTPPSDRGDKESTLVHGPWPAEDHWTASTAPSPCSGVDCMPTDVSASCCEWSEILAAVSAPLPPAISTRTISSIPACNSSADPYLITGKQIRIWCCTLHFHNVDRKIAKIITSNLQLWNFIPQHRFTLLQASNSLPVLITDFLWHSAYSQSHSVCALISHNCILLLLSFLIIYRVFRRLQPASWFL